MVSDGPGSPERTMRSRIAKRRRSGHSKIMRGLWGVSAMISTIADRETVDKEKSPQLPVKPLYPGDTGKATEFPKLPIDFGTAVHL